MNEWMMERMNNTTLTCQQCRSFLQFSTHVYTFQLHISCTKKKTTTVCIKNLSQDIINSLNDRPVPSSYKETLK